ncbi:serine/threonine protein kinase [Tuwongella immobilis]|uniref:Protein kinase domain-containing protein n=1 Tax=Tuwongella immobilis TaxID=692036 RepID=A0A6C2YIZ2_9BACT
MPAPATVADLIDLVRRSQILPEDRLEPELSALTQSGAMPVAPDKLASWLVKQALLTPFQARQLLAGRWRSFMIGGKYKLLDLLGAGGMGAVYLCEHIFMQRLVAIKVLPVQKLTEPSMLERFYREARAAAALNHPNIVRAFDIDQFEKLHFLVMEYVDGASLQEIVGKHGPLSVERAADYIAQTCSGLAHASEAGMVHRDIKPGNLLVDRQGVVKILDMGLARFFGNKNDSVTEKYDERSVLGTADYLAPEQALNQTLDIRADIYSLGATFYFLLSGQTIFPDGTIAQKLIWHQKKEPRSIREFRPDVPDELAMILRRMLAKKPSDRPQNPIEIIQALSPWRTTRVGPPPESEMPKLAPAIQLAKQQMIAPPLPPESISTITPRANLRGSSPGFNLPNTSSGVRTGPISSQSTPAMPVPATDFPSGTHKRRPVVVPTSADAEIADELQADSEAAVQETLMIRQAELDAARSRKGPLIAILTAVVLVALLGGGWFAYQTGMIPGFSPLNRPFPTGLAATPTNAAGAAGAAATPTGGAEMKVNGKNVLASKMADRDGEDATIEMQIVNTGGDSNLYLNTETNFRSPTNFAIKLPIDVQNQFLMELNLPDRAELEAYFANKRIEVVGKVRKDRYGVSITLDSAKQLKVLME